MRYALLLKPHANVRYRQSLQKLALIELQAVLSAWGLTEACPKVEMMAGEPFLTFECSPLPQNVWRAVAGHSAVCLAGEWLENGLLRPLERPCAASLPDDLPHVLKYKGKTNADFTYMMLHCAKAASAFARTDEPLTVLDPMCGKATTLFCALCEGHDAIGVETDAKALAEASAYFERSLKFHHIKHKRQEGSRTLAGGGSAKSVVFETAQDAQTFKTGKRMRLELLGGDAARVSEMLKRDSCHLIISDLPYGVQHAPQENGSMSSLTRLLSRVAPGCLQVLKPGGALAFSFNLHTLRRSDVRRTLMQAGFEVLDAPPYDDFSHWVEQAVDRDVVVAAKPASQTDTTR